LLAESDEELRSYPFSTEPGFLPSVLEDAERRTVKSDIYAFLLFTFQYTA
jgi:hypothetical protein